MEVFQKRLYEVGRIWHGLWFRRKARIQADMGNKNYFRKKKLLPQAWDTCRTVSGKDEAKVVRDWPESLEFQLYISKTAVESNAIKYNLKAFL